MADLSKEKQFFNKITWFSFVFSLLVVWIHSYNAELFLGKTEEMARIYRVEHWIGDGIGQIAVPGFFMISGYLFYRDFLPADVPCQGRSGIWFWQKLRKKWERRIRSVLVPYMLWNFLYYLGYVISSRLPWMNQVVGKGVIPFGLAECVDAISNYTYNYVFWYLHQLILLILLAPMLYLMLRRLWSRVLFLAALWGLLLLDIRLPFVNTDALMYYSSSAALALSLDGRKCLSEQEQEYLPGREQESAKRIVLGVLLILCGGLAFRIGVTAGSPAGLVACRLLAVAGLWMVVQEEWLPEAGSFAKHNFFLYATHFAFVRFINKAGAKVLPAGTFVPLILYLMMPALVLGISETIGSILRRYAPGIWKLLSGGR